MTVELICGDAIEELQGIASQSVDAVITDPPYPCIKRDYGIWTVEEWWTLIVEGVVPEVRRILKPTGSAVFILQPNSEHVGQMRGWLWEFMAWVCREWNMVQDAWWWNDAAVPTVHCHADIGLMRPSLKSMIWAGESNCYRHQEAVLLPISESTLGDGRIDDDTLHYYPSGWNGRVGRAIRRCIERGGVTPLNVIAMANKHSRNGHGAGTPLKLADWWTRYICPPGGTVLDPFVGSGTMMLAALQNGCDGIGIDKEQGYIDIAQRIVDEAMGTPVQAEMAI